MPCTTDLRLAASTLGLSPDEAIDNCYSLTPAEQAQLRGETAEAAVLTEIAGLEQLEGFVLLYAPEAERDELWGTVARWLDEAHGRLYQLRAAA